MDTAVETKKLERQLSKALGERNRAVAELEDMRDAAKRASAPSAEPVLSDAQALAAEVLLIDASLETGEEWSAVELDPDDWQRLVDMARKVGGQ